MTTCTTVAWKKKGRLPGMRLICMGMSLVSGDDTVTVATGLKKIYGYTVGLPTITAKSLDYATISGGTITLHVTDPVAAETLIVTAYGI